MNARRPTAHEAVAHLADAQTVAYQRECIRYWREKFGDDFAEQVRNEFTGPELQAVNLVMEIHDAQLDVCTIAELEKAVEIVKQELRHKRMRVVEVKEA